MSEEESFRLLVSVDARKQGDAVNGGVFVSLFAGQYFRNALPFPVHLQLRQDQQITLPEVSPLYPSGWTSRGVAASLEEQVPEDTEEPEEGKEVTQLALRIKEEAGKKWCDDLVLEIARISASKAGRTPSKTPSSKAGPALRSLSEMLSSDQRCSGQLRDEALELTTSERSSCVFNLAYTLGSCGVLTITLLPSEAPVVCRNFSCRTVWMSQAWSGANRPLKSFQRLVPNSSRELPCSLLRTFEVFPNAELTSPRSSGEAVYARLSLDPEAVDMDDEDGQWHLDVTLGADNDLYWQPPVPPGDA